MNEFPYIEVIADDRKPDIRVQFVDRTTNKPVNLADSNITVKGRFREAGSSTSLYDVTLAKVDSGLDGWALWSWPAAGLAYDPGKYEIQCFLVYATGSTPHTARNVVKIKIREKFTAP